MVLMDFRPPLPVVTWLASSIQHYRQFIYYASGDWSVFVVWWVACSDITMDIHSCSSLHNGHPSIWNTHELQVQDCFVHLHLKMYSFFLSRQVHIIKSWVLYKKDHFQDHFDLWNFSIRTVILIWKKTYLCKLVLNLNAQSL